MEGHEEKGHKNEGFCAPCFMEGRKDGATYELRSMIAQLENVVSMLKMRLWPLTRTDPFQGQDTP